MVGTAASDICLGRIYFLAECKALLSQFDAELATGIVGYTFTVPMPSLLAMLSFASSNPDAKMQFLWSASMIPACIFSVSILMRPVILSGRNTIVGRRFPSTSH